MYQSADCDNLQQAWEQLSACAQQQGCDLPLWNWWDILSDPSHAGHWHVCLLLVCSQWMRQLQHETDRFLLLQQSKQTQLIYPSLTKAIPALGLLQCHRSWAATQALFSHQQSSLQASDAEALKDILYLPRHSRLRLQNTREQTVEVTTCRDLQLLPLTMWGLRWQHCPADAMGDSNIQLCIDLAWPQDFFINNKSQFPHLLPLSLQILKKGPLAFRLFQWLTQSVAAVSLSSDWALSLSHRLQNASLDRSGVQLLLNMDQAGLAQHFVQGGPELIQAAESSWFDGAHVTEATQAAQSRWFDSSHGPTATPSVAALRDSARRLHAHPGLDLACACAIWSPDMHLAYDQLIKSDKRLLPLWQLYLTAAESMPSIFPAMDQHANLEQWRQMCPWTLTITFDLNKIKQDQLPFDIDIPDHPSSRSHASGAMAQGHLRPAQSTLSALEKPTAQPMSADANHNLNNTQSAAVLNRPPDSNSLAVDVTDPALHCAKDTAQVTLGARQTRLASLQVEQEIDRWHGHNNKIDRPGRNNKTDEPAYPDLTQPPAVYINQENNVYPSSASAAPGAGPIAQAWPMELMMEDIALHTVSIVDLQPIAIEPALAAGEQFEIQLRIKNTTQADEEADPQSLYSIEQVDVLLDDAAADQKIVATPIGATTYAKTMQKNKTMQPGQSASARAVFFYQFYTLPADFNRTSAGEVKPEEVEADGKCSFVNIFSAQGDRYRHLAFTGTGYHPHGLAEFWLHFVAAKVLKCATQLSPQLMAIKECSDPSPSWQLLTPSVTDVCWRVIASPSRVMPPLPAVGDGVAPASSHYCLQNNVVVVKDCFMAWTLFRHDLLTTAGPLAVQVKLLDLTLAKASFTLLKGCIYQLWNLEWAYNRKSAQDDAICHYIFYYFMHTLSQTVCTNILFSADVFLDAPAEGASAGSDDELEGLARRKLRWLYLSPQLQH